METEGDVVGIRRVNVGESRSVRLAVAVAALGAAVLVQSAGATVASARPVAARAATPPPAGIVAARKAATAELEAATNGAAHVSVRKSSGYVGFIGSTKADPIPRAKGVSASASPE